MSVVHLETARLVIRDHVPSDEASHHRLISDERVMRYLPDIRSQSSEESARDLKLSLEEIHCPDRKLYFFRIEDKITHELIGEIGYTVTAFTPVGKLVHLGYFSFEQYWGKGYMSEALAEVIRFAFAENRVYRITTGCLKENTGSERVMQKCGLILEAEHVDWEWFEDRMQTRLEYRLLRGEWLKAHPGA